MPVRIHCLNHTANNEFAYHKNSLIQYITHARTYVNIIQNVYQVIIKITKLNLHLHLSFLSVCKCKRICLISLSQMERML